MGSLITSGNGDGMGWYRHRLSCLAGAALVISGCAGIQTGVPSGASGEVRAQANTMVRELRMELATLRADLAAARISVAKKEAELQALRRQVDEFRKSETDLRQVVESKQADAAALRGEREQLLKVREELQGQLNELAHARETGQSAGAGVADTGLLTQVNSLKMTVDGLSSELERIKREYVRAKPARNQPTSSRPTGADTKDTGFDLGESGTGRFRLSSESTKNSLAPVRLVDESTIDKHSLRVTVQPGESLWLLARRHGVTIDQLKTLNALMSDHLVVGQPLLVPAAESSLAQQPLP